MDGRTLFEKIQERIDERRIQEYMGKPAKSGKPEDEDS